MCLICSQLDKFGDWEDARGMLDAARREPNSIPEQHLEEVEMYINALDWSANYKDGK